MNKKEFETLFYKMRLKSGVATICIGETHIFADSFLYETGNAENILLDRKQVRIAQCAIENITDVY